MAPRRSKGPQRYGVGSYGTTSDGRHRWRYTSTLSTGRRKRIEIKKRELSDLDHAVESFLEQEKRLGYTLNVDERTVAQYCATWLEHRVAVRSEPSTQIKYKTDLELLLPYFGDTPVRTLRPDQIQAAIHLLATQTKPDGSPRFRPLTITSAVRTLHNALEPLVREGSLARNPASNTLLDLPKNRPYQPRILTVDELGQLLDAAQGNWIEVLLHVYAATGLRRGEALGLRWEDVDWKDVDIEARQIRPVQAVKELRGHVLIGPLKTPASRQPIPLSDDLAAWLQVQHVRVTTMRVAHGGPAWKQYNLVFPSRTGMPWNPLNVSQVFKRLLRKAGLPHTVTIHGLRHSYGTLLAQRYNAKVVQRLLRHADVATTYRYIHSSRSEEQEAAETVATLLRRRRS